MWSAALLAGLLVPSVVRQRDAVREIGRRRRVERYRLRSTCIGVATCGIVALLAYLPVAASFDAHRVKEGVVNASADAPASDGVVTGRYLPWRALPAFVTWAPKAERLSLTNTCESLRLLGVRDGQFLLYDSKLKVMFRVPSRAGTVASASTLHGCRNLSRRAKAGSGSAKRRRMP